MSKIVIFGRMWPPMGLSPIRSGQVRLSSQFFSFFFKSSLVRVIAIFALIPMIQACDVVRNSPGHRAMYHYDSIQDAAARQHLQEQGYLQKGGLNDE